MKRLCKQTRTNPVPCSYNGRTSWSLWSSSSFTWGLSLIGCMPDCPSGYSPASRRRNVFELGIIAMNIKGETGAASSVPFPYCGWSQEKDCIDELVQQPSQTWKN
ncbi:uncharacterized protein WM294_001675, partial [Sarcoramphus papa]